MLLTLGLLGLLVAHGPIVQPADYNEFADRSVLLGIPHAADVLSNLGFAIVGGWGWRRLSPMRDQLAIRAGWCGYRVFLIGLLLTAAGSAFFHLAPDNARLVWDRLPIALACAGLLAAVRAAPRGADSAGRDVFLLALWAVVGVAWWHYTDDAHGSGDLRPYLLLQLLPLILIPLWQALYAAPRADRVWFGAALLLYVVAKLAEVADHELLAALGWLSGHTLKHLLATAAAGLIVIRLCRRLDAAPRSGVTEVSVRTDAAQGPLARRLPCCR